MLRKLQELKDKEQGFTIIEVLIVLAIAGLIMVIVFLAVPALQRNQRNTSRDADASKVAAAMSSCMGNRNGTVASCNSSALLTSAGGLDTTKLQYLTTITYAGTAPSDTTNSTINFSFGYKCGADGSTATTSGATTRQGVVFYSTENGSGSVLKCLDI